MRWSFLLFRDTIDTLGLDAKLLVQPFFTSAHEAQRSEAILDGSSASDFVGHRADVRVDVGDAGDVGLDIDGLDTFLRVSHRHIVSVNGSGNVGRTDWISVLPCPDYIPYSTRAVVSRRGRLASIWKPTSCSVV